VIATTALWLALALGCRHGEADLGTDDGTTPDVTGPPTDTIPAFYGHVPKNLFVLSIDTFRRDHAGKYAPGSMPFLEQLMNEGFTADDHMECANWTFMGTGCSVNGRHNEENGFIPELGLLRAPMPDGPTLARSLSDAGRYTILATGNSWFSDEWNNAQGYVESGIIGGNALNIYGSGEALLASARLDGRADDGWMLHVHVMEPHPPYAPPASYLAAETDLPPLPGDWDLALKDDHYQATYQWPLLSPEDQAILESHMQVRYQGELDYLDDQLESMWLDLESRSLLDDTLVVIFNDHGEQIWDHGNESHAYALYHEENDGIFVLWAKNIVPGTWTRPTSQIDIAPTVLGLLDVPIPPEMTGIPLGQGEEDRATFALTSARLNTIQSVRQNGVKLIYNWTGTVEMYDLAADPLELTNVFDPTDPVAQQLWGLLLPHIELADDAVLDQEPIWPDGLPRPGDPTDTAAP
jgi:arylsulfatase A-like enzyme